MRQAYEEIFGERVPFTFNSQTAAMLCPSNPQSLLSADGDSLVRAMAVAGYSSRSSESLATSFRVSKPTMALRLIELELVCD